jgi:serine/threonine protein phosphatase PrpC
MALHFESYALSDRGLVRDGNEDAAITSPTLIAVADGMGGHAAGEVASTIAVTTLDGLRPVLANPEIDTDSREDLLLNAAVEIDNQILASVKENPENSGMGTTLTALNIIGDMVELLHVGGSRAYKYAKGKVTQISYDHTVMQELLDQGRLTADEVSAHPQRALLTQALMGNSGIDPVLVAYPAKVGDSFLLCSDGLTGVLSDSEIASIIKKNEAMDVPAALVTATKAKGAPDNVTVIFATLSEAATTKTELLGAAHE